jgi:hypothetical protein
MLDKWRIPEQTALDRQHTAHCSCGAPTPRETCLCTTAMAAATPISYGPQKPCIGAQTVSAHQAVLHRRLQVLYTDIQVPAACKTTHSTVSISCSATVAIPPSALPQSSGWGNAQSCAAYVAEGQPKLTIAETRHNMMTIPIHPHFEKYLHNHKLTNTQATTSACRRICALPPAPPMQSPHAAWYDKQLQY